MISVHEVMARLDGNGYEQKVILETANKLNQLAIMKEEVTPTLKDVYADDELEELLGILKAPTMQQQVLSNALASFSKRQEQCYLMHTVESKSFANIAEELGVTKGTVGVHINRAREKIQEFTGI